MKIKDIICDILSLSLLKITSEDKLDYYETETKLDIFFFV